MPAAGLAAEAGRAPVRPVAHSGRKRCRAAALGAELLRVTSRGQRPALPPWPRGAGPAAAARAGGGTQRRGGVSPPSPGDSGPGGCSWLGADSATPEPRRPDGQLPGPMSSQSRGGTRRPYPRVAGTRGVRRCPRCPGDSPSFSPVDAGLVSLTDRRDGPGARVPLNTLPLAQPLSRHSHPRMSPSGTGQFPPSPAGSWRGGGADPRRRPGGAGLCPAAAAEHPRPQLHRGKNPPTTVGFNPNPPTRLRAKEQARRGGRELI